MLQGLGLEEEGWEGCMAEGVSAWPFRGAGVAECAKMQALPRQPCTPEPPPSRLQAPPLAPRPFCSITTPPSSLPCPLRVHSPPRHVLEQVGKGHRALSPGLGT